MFCFPQNSQIIADFFSAHIYEFCRKIFCAYLRNLRGNYKPFTFR